MERRTCVICGKSFEGHGNNAWPVSEGLCCDACNITSVLPARMQEAILETFRKGGK